MRSEREDQTAGHAGAWDDQWGREDTERFLVSALLQCPAETVTACSRLRGKHFRHPAFGAVWDGIAGCERPENVDAVAVMREAFARHMRRDDGHFAVWARDLMDANPAPVTARYHLRRLRDLAARERVRDAIAAAISAYRDGLPPDVVQCAFRSVMSGAA